MKKLIMGICIFTTPALTIDVTSEFGATLYQQSKFGCQAAVVNEGLADKFVSVEALCHCVAQNFVTSLSAKDAVAIEQGVEDKAVAKRVSKLSTDVNEKCMKQFANPEAMKNKGK